MRKPPAQLRTKRRATIADLGLTKAEFAVLRRLSTPEKIQKYLLAMGQNFELEGDSCASVRMVLRAGHAHCIEGAFIAAAALWVHGEPPLLLDLRAVQDSDHVVALFRRKGHWGCISKTNGPDLRWRDPVYRTLRELALSFLHEYSNKRDHKSLREYSVPFDLRRADPKVWVTGEDGAWEIAEKLDEIRHYRLVTKAQEKLLQRRDPFEREVALLTQYKRPRVKPKGR
ncbi:MAG: hypothetical protein JSS40_02225 [Proteobacteria bacterium]|nr:hypothetical protein [Pseudomonadota bacterium]